MPEAPLPIMGVIPANTGIQTRQPGNAEGCQATGLPSAMQVDSAYVKKKQRPLGAPASRRQRRLGEFAKAVVFPIPSAAPAQAA